MSDETDDNNLQEPEYPITDEQIEQVIDFFEEQCKEDKHLPVAVLTLDEDENRWIIYTPQITPAFMVEALRNLADIIERDEITNNN